MGTPNFARPSNASKYFVVLANEEREYKECQTCFHRHYSWEHTLDELKECENECEDPTFEEGTENHAPESWECEDLIDNLGYAIEEIGGVKENESFNDRNYNRQTLGYLSEERNFGDIYVSLKLTAIIQSAYYEGATLDYIVQLEIEGEDYDISTGSNYDTDFDDAISTSFNQYISDMNEGMLKIQGRHAENWLEKVQTEMEAKLENLFETYSEHKLGCSAVFSNGEAMYHKV